MPLLRRLVSQTRTPNFASRLAQLVAGLVLYGIGLALMVRAGLGLAPWDVLHQGLARQLHLEIGTATIIVGFAVLLFWIPLRQTPGIGTLSNALLLGLTMNLVLPLIPVPTFLAGRVGFLVVGTVFTGIATGAYIGAGMGPGPRDGLMTGIAARGHSIRVVRTGLELSVLTAGLLLGGTVGVGTLVYALSIGPMAHLTIPWMTRSTRSSNAPAAASEPAAA